MLTAAALVLRDGQSDALIAIIAGISFRSRRNRSAAPHQQDTPCPHLRCPSTLHHKRTPEFTGIFYGYPPQAPMPYPIYPGAVPPATGRVRTCSDVRAVFGSVPETRFEPHIASNTGPATDFEDIPLTEPDDDIRPEPDGDGEAAICPAMKNWRPCLVKMTRSRPCRL